MDDIKHFIENHIPQIDSPEKVYQLFAGLGYKTLDPSFKGKEAWGLSEKDRESVNDIYAIANYQKRFQILLIELKNPSTAALKNISLSFEREIQYPFFIFTSDYQNYTFVLVEKIREDIGVWKRKLVKLNLDRTNAYYTDKWVLSNMAIKEGVDEPLLLYKTLEEAFSVEKVSKIFFDDYKTIFFEIRKFLLEQKTNIKQAHEFSQQLLNRIMFIYFIDKKGWLRNSPKFMKWFWNRYLEEKNVGTIHESPVKDQFYEKWLKVLFLEAFNNRFSHPQYLPQDVRDTLSLAPYLNGGLFKKNELDLLPINLSDEFIERILKFFEKYNFTIKEDLPLDVEVAVDPQMIGYVYESLAIVAEEIYERQDLGIFYTPKVEVDFMCRRSLSEYLAKTTSIKKEILYRLLFDEDKTKIEKLLNLSDYERLEESLDNLSVLDPACGSGAFLVGMLNVLVELYKFIYKRLKRDMTDYQLKKRIIGNSLYGVDVMPWAVHSAELRLWLSLMIESDLSLGELKLYPLLPNLNLKLRVGDSLVQEIGGINLNLRDAAISPPLKRKLSELKREKEKYYNNDPTAKFKTEEGILHEELRIFYEILNERIINLNKKKQSLSIGRGEQLKIFENEISQKELFDEKELREVVEKEKRKIDEEIHRLTEIKSKLKEQKPFIWDIDFAEIFGEKGGFDVVIGNPPYVRQEKIAPPNKLRNEITNDEKREYKEKLLKSVQAHFPFIKTIDKKSDYYVYFYFHGLSLLNEKGTFCFITSNSWLDVGYGKNLQEFLLEYVPITAIYDNQSKRSFEHADVNTIIALFGSPTKNVGATLAVAQDIGQAQGLPLQNFAKFVMFKKSFDEVINTENLLNIERADEVISTDDFRVYPKQQEDLLEEGWEYPEEKEEIATPEFIQSSSEGARNDKSPYVAARSVATKQSQKSLLKGRFETGKYNGNKWGGKYLRAPDIFFTILEKGKGKLVRLGDIAEVRRGFTTGANEFFYLPSKHFDIKEEARFYRLKPKHEGLPEDLRIEEEYLKPVIRSPQECKTIFITSNNLSIQLLVCPLNEKEIEAKKVWRYIKWGEESYKDSNGNECGRFHLRPTCHTRTHWWDLGEKNFADFLWLKAFNDRFLVIANVDHLPNSDRFYSIFLSYDYKTLFDSAYIALNNTISHLFTELNGRINLGEGALDNMTYEARRIFIVNPSLLEKKKIRVEREIKNVFEECGINPKQPIRSQNPNPLLDRKALDDVVFDILGLTQAERDEVYWAVCELVKNRLEKARSV